LRVKIFIMATWLIRWNPGKDPCPTVIFPGADPARWALGLFGGNPAHVSSFALFEGYLFDLDSPHFRPFLSNPKAPDPLAPALCIGNAYACLGDKLFDVLRGGYALAVWDAAKGCLVAGRDQMGFQPLYFYWDGRSFMLSPDLDMILASPGAPGEVNRLVLAEYLLGAWSGHQRSTTFYEGINRLQSAHHLRLSTNGLVLERYWDPFPPGFSWASREELETFPSLLERAVGRCLSIGADSLALSGGFDSVGIAILAAEQRHRKTPLHAVSLRSSLREMDEGETQAAVAHALNMPQLLCTDEECLEGISFVEASLSLSKTSPLPVLSHWQAMYTGLLKEAASLGLHKLMMGTGGDEMLTVDLAYGQDRLAALDVPGLLRFYTAIARSSHFSPLTIARVVLWDYAARPILVTGARSALERIAPATVERLRLRHLAAPAWIAPSDPGLRQLLDDRRLHPVQEAALPGEGAYIRKTRGLPLSPIMMVEHEQAESWARSIGFTLLYPYLDCDLVSLVMRIHPEELISAGRLKSPLRRLVAERLPAVPLPPRKVDFTRPVHQLLRTHGQAAWRKLAGPHRLTGLGLIDPGRLNPLMEGYFSGHNQAWLRTWLVLSAEAWLCARFPSVS
jgi:asparagine synthase (glutamine-hydrolysing)